MNTQKTFIIFLSFVLFSCGSALHSDKGIDPEPDTKSIPYYPLEKQEDLDVLLNAISNSRVVLLGESTHGTHEYYKWSE